MSAASRQLFVTTALPYANGNFHIGHIMEYIQADIWVRTMRMQGHEVHFVGADDAHGAPIMIAAEKAGLTQCGNLALGRVAQLHVKGHIAAFDAEVLDLLGGNKVFAGVGIDDGLQRLQQLFWGGHGKTSEMRPAV